MEVVELLGFFYTSNMHWRKDRLKQKETEPGWKQPHSLLQYPQTPAAPFHFALWGSSGLGALHSKCETCSVGSAGLHPFSGGSVSSRLLLNLTGSRGWVPGLPQHWPRSTWVTSKCGKPEIISQTLLTSITEDRPEVILFLPWRFFLFKASEKKKNQQPTTKKLTSDQESYSTWARALLWMQSQPPLAEPTHPYSLFTPPALGSSSPGCPCAPQLGSPSPQPPAQYSSYRTTGIS